MIPPKYIAIWRILYDDNGEFRPPTVYDDLPGCIRYLSDSYGDYNEELTIDSLRWLELAVPMLIEIQRYVAPMY